MLKAGGDVDLPGTPTETFLSSCGQAQPMRFRVAGNKLEHKNPETLNSKP